MVKAIEKGTKMMVESIDYINNMSLVLEEKQLEIMIKCWRNNFNTSIPRMKLTTTPR
jgi:hypothetical protein